MELDPVFRCDSCHRLVLLTSIHKIGTCPRCGNKRVRNVTVFDDQERAQMVNWGLVDFVNQFSEVADAE
jgi:DNA-directed RNA polymerase subunit RPC12/RpoP